MTILSPFTPTYVGILDVKSYAKITHLAEGSTNKLGIRHMNKNRECLAAGNPCTHGIVHSM